MKALANITSVTHITTNDWGGSYRRRLHLTNGWSVSVVWGRGMYARGETFEVAVFDANDNWNCEPAYHAIGRSEMACKDEPLSYCTINEVVAIVELVGNL